MGRQMFDSFNRGHDQREEEIIVDKDQLDHNMHGPFPVMYSCSLIFTATM